MTVQNIKNIKFQPEDFTERYVLKTPKFYLGIEALIDSSPTMKEVFKEAPIPKLQKEKVENDAAYETWALWQLLNTIKITPPVNPALLTYAQRVAYVAKDAVDYINAEGIPVSWRKESSEPDARWVFWVLLPDQEFKERFSVEPVGKRLEINGFVREPLTHQKRN